MNLKVVAPMLPSNFQEAINARAGEFDVVAFSRSGNFRYFTFGCYDLPLLGFLEFLVAQALVYAIAVSYYFFHEPLYINLIGDVVFFLCGIGLFYIN